jgi:nucleotide-binding universal stress UspA family protein
MSYYKVNKILIPLDFSKTSLKALDHATYLAKLCDAEINLLHVPESLSVNTGNGYFSPPAFHEDYEKEITEQSNKKLNDIADRLKKKSKVRVNTLTVIGNPKNEILNFSKKIKADLIVMGTHGISGIKEFFIGSNTFSIIKDAKCPVLSIQRNQKNPGFENILVPFRDKPHSREKINYAIDLGLLYGSTIHVIGIDTEFNKAHKRKIELEAEQIKKLVEKKGLTCKVKVISNPYLADVILKHATQTGADLIISMSDMDRENITEYFSGPFAQQIVNHSPIPVLSIRPQFNPDTIDLRFY